MSLSECGIIDMNYSEIQSRGHPHDKQTTTDFRISQAGFIVKYSLKFLGNMLPCRICSY